MCTCVLSLCVSQLNPTVLPVRLQIFVVSAEGLESTHAQVELEITTRAVFRHYSNCLCMNCNPANKCLRTFGLSSSWLLSLVFSFWLQSDLFLTRNSLFHLFKILAKVFSRRALESYLPRVQEVIKSEIAKWCTEPGSVDVYSATRSLMFRIAIGVLLGLRLEEERIVYLEHIFGQLMSNLFSLPIDAPFSGLRKVRVNNFRNTQQIHEQPWICFVFIQKHFF